MNILFHNMLFMKKYFAAILIASFLRVQGADLSDLEFGEIDWGEPFSIKYGVTKCNPDATGELIIPAEHNGRTVLIIDDNAFEDCAGLTRGTLPEGIEEIGFESFSGCTSLEEINFPESLIRIWRSAFEGCSSLKEAILPPDLGPGLDGIAIDYNNSVSYTHLTLPTNREV